MSSDDIAISARNLAKAYRVYSHPLQRVLHKFGVSGRGDSQEIKALRDVSFDIRKGETVGVIGRNGSGKSTLLQIICGILKPSSGSVTVNGRISALLELGAGFHPEFTGRENIYFQGALMGFTKAGMDARFDDIASFADIGDFVERPVRIYSSGMYVRLAFAVAVSLEPEILVVDEALAVGDFAFRAKCYARIKRMTDCGTSLLFVSHDLETVKSICGRAIYLKNGEIRANDSAGEVCNLFFGDYTALGNSISTMKALEQPQDGALHSSKLAEILEVTLHSGSTRHGQDGILFGEEIVLSIRHIAHANLDSLTVAFHIRDERQIDIIGSNTRIEGCDIDDAHSGDIRVTEFRFANSLRKGEYAVCVGLAADWNGRRIFPDWRDQTVVFKSTAEQRWALVGACVQITHRPG
jgi:ABC-type polysaccharide/polyol phosphate transport system ATPase subunit